MISTPHPDLVPVLEKHGLSWSLFSKRGRLPKALSWVKEKRRDVITELHQAGMAWKTMVEVTRLSQGAIQRGTRVMWNDASRRNRQESAARVGAARKGERKPWLSARLKKEWAEGKFYALLEDPKSKFGKCGGYGTWCKVTGLKCSNRGHQFRVRSTYEREAVQKLEGDDNVVSYEYEPPLVLFTGRRIYPDFIITDASGDVQLVEVKPQWVLLNPTMGNNAKQIRRLRVAEEYASQLSWGFEIWTEKALGLL